MRIMGLDVGTKTIGVAVSDPLGWTAQGITTIKRTSLEQDLVSLEKYIKEYGVESIVLGLPVNMNGTMGASVDMAREFGDIIHQRTNLSVYYQDERLSTVSAQRVLLEGDVSRSKRRNVVDKLAAVFILQTYLDNPNHKK